MQLGTNIPEYVRAKRDQNQPHILILGNRKEPTQSFVIIEEHAIQQPSLLHAVDACFKAFYVLDLDYPAACLSIWEFFEGIIYEMKRQEPTKLSAQVKILRSFFKT